MKTSSAGKTLMSATAVGQMIGPYPFDFDETPIYKASWPPDSKYRWPQMRFTIPILTAVGAGCVLARHGLNASGKTR